MGGTGQVPAGSIVGGSAMPKEARGGCGPDGPSCRQCLRVPGGLRALPQLFTNLPLLLHRDKPQVSFENVRLGWSCLRERPWDGPGGLRGSVPISLTLGKGPSSKPRGKTGLGQVGGEVQRAFILVIFSLPEARSQLLLHRHPRLLMVTELELTAMGSLLLSAIYCSPTASVGLR